MLFETGYGPSGLPHIGTFGEVARTTMVRHAFRVLTDDKIKTKLLAFSDDMDGLRKVPDNVPNRDMMAAHLGKPLTRGARPVFERTSFVRCRQQCPPARVPRSLRLRLRVREFYRLLYVGPLRRDAAEDARRLRQGDGDHSPDSGAGPSRDLFAISADQQEHRRGAAGTHASPRRCRRHRDLSGPGHRRRGRNAGHGRQCEMPVEGRLGDALGCARRRLRDGGQGSDRLGQALGPDRQGAGWRAAGRVQL